MPKLAVAQIECVVGDVPTNLSKGLTLITEAARQGADVICLPECFSTGLMPSRMGYLAEPVPGPTSESLCAAAAGAGAWIIAGMAERGGDEVYNSALAIAPDGTLAATYRKVYLYMQEAEVFARGDRACLQDLGFTTAGVAICYDYIFPEYIRHLALNGARLLIHPTAWVDTEVCRSFRYSAAQAYRAQCIVRALENGIFVMSANHCGLYDDGGYLEGVGHSAIIAPWGEVLAAVPEGEGVAVAEVDFAAAAKWSAAAAPYLEDWGKVRRPF